MGANLRDVARRAGVSLATASRVLSGAEYPVGSALRGRVEQAATDLDYVPNAQAQTLLRGSTSTVGVLVGDVRDPYFSEIINGIHAEVTGRRLLLTICNTDRDVNRELEYFRMLQAHRAGVVIVAGSELDDEVYRSGMTARSRSFQENGGRVVALGNRFLAADRVLVDNIEGAARLGRHLVALGHREVGVAAGDARVVSTADRVAGLREAVTSSGGRLYVRYGTATRDGGYTTTRALLDAHPEVTAVVGSADQMALGALVYLRERGVTVPGEVSVAGFNDIDIARDLTPALTSVRLPLRDMGAAALRLALAPKRETARCEEELFTQLVVRSSTGPRT